MQGYRCLLALSLIVPLGLTGAARADGVPADTGFAVLWHFPAAGGQTADPALFAAVPRGKLYGATLFGGAHRRGSVFELTPPAAAGAGWHMKLLWSFGGKDGVFARPGLVKMAPGGKVQALYGTTEAGGGRPEDVALRDTPIDRIAYVTASANGEKGAGSVFELVPPSASHRHWSETVLYSFAGRDGARPNARLVRDASGALYGTTAYGGARGQGTVFKLTPPSASKPRWTETVLHNFRGPDGAQPNGALIFDARGALYGTTFGGGARLDGTVFKLSPPSASDPHWTETVLHTFAGLDGTLPQAGLTFDKSGALLGTASFGGAYGERAGTPVKVTRGITGIPGVLFKLTPPTSVNRHWSFTVLHHFLPFTEPDHATDRLILDESGAIYGASPYGGGPRGSPYRGAAYRLAPPTGPDHAWTLTVLHRFTEADGIRPKAGLVPGADGVFYGTTWSGGAEGGGTIFRLTCCGRAHR